MGDYTLRRSRSSDLEWLMVLSAQARARYLSMPAFAHVADAPALTIDRLESCRVVVAVADLDAEILGFAAMRSLDDLLYLDNISVATGSSGRGIGMALMASVIAHAARLPAPAVTLTTFREPVWNGPWFRRHGFMPMLPTRIGPGLRAVMDRQWQSLDPATRETLWRPVGDGEQSTS